MLLISCYELGHQPIGLASPLGFLHNAGFDPAALDLAIEPLDHEALTRARFIGISVPMHTALRLGARVAARARAASPDAHICFYGLYASLNAAWLLERHADSVVGGEYETRLVQLVEQLDRGLSHTSVRTQPNTQKIVLERQRFVMPRRTELAPLEGYAPLLTEHDTRIAGYLEATRGCRHLCRHCPVVPVYDGRVFVVPREVVLRDADQQIAAGARHLTFGDPDFLNGPGHVMPIVRELHRSHPDVSFDVTIKVEHLLQHHTLLPELRELGCGFVVSAFESLSADVLRKLDKGHARADLDRALALADAARLPLRPTFVPFTPWSSLDDFVELTDWLAANDLETSVDPIQLAIRLLVPPGSRLLDLDATDGWPGPLDPEALTHRWTHRDPRVDALQRRVAARVEAAANEKEEPTLTHAAIRALAHEATGRQLAAAATRPPRGPRRDRPPRLAEAWFC